MMDELVEFSNQRQMKINAKKTCVMKFCKSRTIAYPTEIKVGEHLLEVKTEMKILGVIVQPTLKWASNCTSMCKKVYRNMWAIRRMKVLGMDTFTILDYYMKEVRVHLELAVPVWHNGLTYKLTADLERVQRVAVGILVGGVPYAQACATIGLKPLQVRRLKLCEQFAVTTASEENRHSDLFKAQKNPRTNKDKFREHFCRKSRFFKSPLPYLTRILNDS